MNKEKILLITQYFPPDMAGTGRVMEELAEDLSSYGYEVVVLTGKSHYFNLHNYGDYCGKVPVKRIWFPHFNKDIKIGRLFNFISFPVMILTHLFFIKNFDKIIIVSNPPTIVGAGAIINKLLNKKVYYILQDLYPDLAIHLGVISKNSVLENLMSWINKQGFNRVEKIILLSDSMKKYFDQYYSKWRDKTVVITNWADPQKIQQLPKDNPWSRVSGYYEKFVILYAGNIGLFQEFDVILKTAELFRDDKDTIFLFVGEGGDKNRLQKIVIERNLENVDFMSYISDEDYNKLLASADCFIASLKSGMEKFGFPGKIYSYLAAGRPIIAITDSFGEFADLVLKNNVGFTVNNESELENVIKKIKNDKSLMERLSFNSHNLLLNKFTRSKIIHQYLNILK